MVCVCVLSTVLLSGTVRCSRFVYVLLQSWNQPFFLRALVLFLENGVRNQDLGTSSPYCHKDIVTFGSYQLIEHRIIIGVCFTAPST